MPKRTEGSFKKVSKASKKVTPKKAGRPPFEPTDEQKKQVLRMVAMGMRHEDICLLILNPTTGEGISTATLHKHFKPELDAGAAEGKFKIGSSLFKMMEQGSVPAAIFLAKVRLGWSEKVQVEDVTKRYVIKGEVEADSPEAWVEENAPRPTKH